MSIINFEKFSSRHLSKVALAPVFSLILSAGVQAATETPEAVVTSSPAYSSPNSNYSAHSLDDSAIESGSMKMSGNTDYDFATMMRMHHERGIQMSQTEMDKGKDSVLRSLAKKNIEAQKKDIVELDRWLAEHKKP